MIFETVIKSKFLYAAAIISQYNDKYTTKLEGILYRILKCLFHIHLNFKTNLFQVLKVETPQNIVNRIQRKLKGNTDTKVIKQNPIEYLSLKAIKL